jgi:hypothetical protein
MAAHHYARQHGGRLDVDGTGVVGKAAIEDWFYGRARPLERMSALECGSHLSNFRSGSKLRNLRSFGKRPLLMARLPRPPIIPPENQDLQRKPGAQLVEKRLARAAASRLSRAGR